MGKKKNVKHTQTVLPKKQPKTYQNPEGYRHQLIAWHFHRMDNDGKWPCTMEIIREIQPRLHEYEIKTWNQIFERGTHNHPLPINKLERPAQKRLSDLGLDDTDSLYQLKITNGGGKQRLWGIKRENIFQILWWDPLHTVYIPSRRR